MTSTNFDLAPPARTVDGLFAVPADIQRVDAALTFDGATATGTGDATIQFITGTQAGNPIFDLRQTVTGVWLDGLPVPAGQFAQHDFGGGPNAELRVLQSVLAPGTAHTLRLTYSLGLPQASTAGSYQPGLTWSAGPRLTFNFGFTDLGAGRYLEAWAPANLIYDQFALNLRVDVLNTTIAHSVITNGQVAVLGTNRWSITFPTRFTAFSPLLEVRATDTLVFASDVVTLPVSGIAVTVEAWKLASNPADLTVQVNLLKSWLADNETTIGSYLHGNRFVCFLNVGGMEYDGGTTSAAPSLRHEGHHSWWGRGVKPASQPDGWWDEAWTVYHDGGAMGSTPFDFTTPAVTLHPGNPWIRVTAPGSYSDGERFFRGVAATIGVPNLKALMAEFYGGFHARPVTTEQLEAFLIARSGSAALVDAFHRFVYGFPDPAPAPDLWLRDDPAHMGADSWSGDFWNSPDLWVRHEDDGGLASEAPEVGQDNWFLARVRNRATSTARHFVVTFNVLPWAGTEFTYPGDFLPSVAAVAGFDLAPGAERIVKARWPAALVPPEGTHACLLAAVLARGDQPVAGRHVWEHNNLAQKNLTIVDLVPNDWFILPFVLNRWSLTRRTRTKLELVRPAGWSRLEGSLLHPSKAVLAPQGGKLGAVPQAEDFRQELLDCGGATAAEPRWHGIWTSHARRPAVAGHFAGGFEAPFRPGKAASMLLATPRNTPLLLGLRLKVPREAKPGTVLRCALRHREAERIVGGLSIEIRVRSRGRGRQDAATSRRSY
jgi:hypothetical protein